MDCKSLPDKRLDVPLLPIKTYQWEDLRRDREAGAYPWTHLSKPKLEGEITAEDVLRESTPRRSMSREVSRERTRSRTRSPDLHGQKILNLDSSPGSSRKIDEDGVEDCVNIPNFSKEVSLDSDDDDPINEAVNRYLQNPPNETAEQFLTPTIETHELKKNVSPKSILKRRSPSQEIVKPSSSVKDSKCCHPIVNKIKHIAEKTLHKNDKSPNFLRKKEKEEQSILQLKTSPGAMKRHKFAAIKLGDSDEMSKTLSAESSPNAKKKKDHIYEDIERIQTDEVVKNIHFSPDVLEALVSTREEKKEGTDQQDSSEIKSVQSQDPSLINEEYVELKPEEHIMETLHKHTSDVEQEALILDADSEEPDIEEVIQNQLEEDFGPQRSPNITITEITDETEFKSTFMPIQGNSNDISVNDNIVEVEIKNEWSNSHSDHEYEIIGKPPPNIVFTSSSVEDAPINIDDKFSSTASLEHKYLQQLSDDELIHNDDEINEHEISQTDAEILQKEIEDRYFVSTPSTMSRTECDVSTSQVDSSALENLPLKRDSRGTNDTSDSKLQQRFKEQREKLRSQAGKLKTKLQSMKTRQFSLPERSKFKLPQMPERPKFTLPDRRKFSLPERPKFKKINISEKLSLGDRKKFSFPERPKFNMPDMSKFKIPEKAKINFSNIGKKKEILPDQNSVDSSDDIKHIATMEFESRTYPRIFNRRKKSDPRNQEVATSSPVLNRVDTPPPPTFNFATVPKTKNRKTGYSSNNNNEFQEPREYGNLPRATSYDNDTNIESYVHEYDFDKLERDYDEENRIFHEAVKSNTTNDGNNRSSLPDFSSSNHECKHVINEINNDEFFVRPKGISRENIEVRQYLSDEIREAFKTPNNSLALMVNETGKSYYNEEVIGEDADPELYLDDEEGEPVREELLDNDDGYYTFPPVRPSRAKKIKKMLKSVDYIDQSTHASMQFSDLDAEDNNADVDNDIINEGNRLSYESKTLPLPPKRKKKLLKSDVSLNSLNDIRTHNSSYPALWNEREDTEDIIVYRTEHQYAPEVSNSLPQHSPFPPRRRNRSRSSHATSVVDDDRTSHGAESLILDQNLSTNEPGYEFDNNERSESPGYATVDKYPQVLRRSKSKTPPTPRRRKSHSAERKYYTVDRIHNVDTIPAKPLRKKSSTSLGGLEAIQRNVSSGDITQYAEINEPDNKDLNKTFSTGDIINKMKDRPLPPPPRPPRSAKKNTGNNRKQSNEFDSNDKYVKSVESLTMSDNVVEIEVSTQTDPLPDDIDYELGLEENIDISMSSSLRDIRDDESIFKKSQSKLAESPKLSRNSSRSEKSLLRTDPKIQELSKNNFGRTSPTVILVKRRVSSPTRINEREEIVTEASLTVQPINIDENKVPNIPPLPRSDIVRPTRNKDSSFRKKEPHSADEKALEKISTIASDVQFDNLITQKLHVNDLDVGKLNVSELQASKISVSEIEGLTLQINELETKSGQINVKGLELSQSVIDEIVRKFSEIATNSTQLPHNSETQRPLSREEQTQTDETPVKSSDENNEKIENDRIDDDPTLSSPSEPAIPPDRPPPPDLSPLLLSYIQELSIPPASFYQLRSPRERLFSEFYEAQASAVPPPPPTRRLKRRPVHQNESSSDDELRKPSPRRMPPTPRSHEPSIAEAGAQFFRVCHNSISRTLRNLFNSLMSYLGGNEDKKDVQMALVIFLVLIAGLIMFGLSDGRTVHHHHWEFFNPPDNTK